MPRIRPMVTTVFASIYPCPSSQRYEKLSSRLYQTRKFFGLLPTSSVKLSRGLSYLPFYCPALQKNSNFGSLRALYVGNSIAVRNITKCSKLGKRKTCKAVAKRFLRTGKGKLKRWQAGKHHNMMKKRNKRRRQLRKHTYVSKQQLKLLNQMLNGW